MTDQLLGRVIGSLNDNKYKDATDASRELAKESYQISPNTIRRCLKMAGYYSTHKRRVLPLTRYVRNSE